MLTRGGRTNAADYSPNDWTVAYAGRRRWASV